jgi:hypothetical protein
MVSPSLTRVDQRGNHTGLASLVHSWSSKDLKPLVNYESCKAGKASLTFLSMAVIVIGKRPLRL